LAQQGAATEGHPYNGTYRDLKKGSTLSLNVFVALLRGVNVGGNNMISMSALKKSFEAMGFPHVSTYINSGNILFTTKENDARKLEKKIEKMLAKDYQLDSRVVIRSLSEMEKLVASLPRNWTGDTGWRYNVIFLRHTIDSEKILDELVVKKDIEEVVYRPGTLLWSAQVSELTRTNMLKLSSRKIYLDMTIRNLNTTRKLCELMKKLAAASD
jgi:uncharacterized protein (DUF1697 family)